MYDDLVKRLRDAAKMSEALAVLLPYSEGNATAKLYNEAADAIETMCEMVATAHCELANVIQSYEGSKPRWIPVTEQLPEDLQNVLVIDEGRVTIGHCERYYGDEQIYVEWHDTLYYPIDPPFWMPLPEPPKEEEE